MDLSAKFLVSTPEGVVETNKVSVFVENTEYRLKKDPVTDSVILTKVDDIDSTITIKPGVSNQIYIK